MQIVFKNVVPTSQKTPCVFTTNAVQLMQCSHIHAVPNTPCVQSTEPLNVTVGRTHVVAPAFGYSEAAEIACVWL
jgi:hypothetical protein